MNNKIIEQFNHPAPEYRAAPFWAWNGDINPEELRRQIRLMHQMGLGGFFMHARIGLQTEYLGEAWFECISSCIDEARKLGMKAWLYDEDRWPSGAAGGLVTCNPEYRNRKISAEEVECVADLKTSAVTLAVYIARIEGCKASGVRLAVGGEELAAGEKFIHFYLRDAEPDSWFNGQTYLDTLSEEAVAKFIEVTHEKYRQRISADFGAAVPGIFFDEPFFGTPLACRQNDGAYCSPWTAKLPEVFRQRYGYDLCDHLMELFYDVDGVALSRARLNYIDCLTHLFVKAFARQIGTWCEKHNMQATGHLLLEDTLSLQSANVGSCMRSYEYMQAPGMDELTEYWRIYDTAKQVSSVARQFDRKWRLSETYGCTGWDFPFAGHKAIGDWQAALGINLRCQHLFWYTMEGEAKRDFPAAISYQSPWWNEYSCVEDYFARINAVMTEGREVRDLLVIHPIESMWTMMRKGWENADDVEEYNQAFIELRDCLHDANIDFDYGDEDIIARHGRVVLGNDGDPLLMIGKGTYKVVVVPELITVRGSTLKLLKEFRAAGGEVVMIGSPANYLDGVRNEAMTEFQRQCISVTAPGKELKDKVGVKARNVSVTGPDGKEIPRLLYQLRKSEDHCALFICNTGYVEAPQLSMVEKVMVRDRKAAYPSVSIRLKTALKGEVLELDAESGKVYRAKAERTAEGWEIQTGFAAVGSRMFVVNSTVSAENYPVRFEGNAVESRKLDPPSWEIILEEDNVLMLDRPKYRIGSGEWQDNDYVLFVDRKVRESLGLMPRGGAMEQPWVRRGKLSRATTALELHYDFYCEAIPKGATYLALERPDFYEIRINGRIISGDMECGWWCDRSLRKLSVAQELLRLGQNEITLKAQYEEAHPGLEFIYLLGNFGVTVDARSNRMTVPVNTLKLGDWCSQGLPYYSGNLYYKCTVASSPKSDARTFLRLPEFCGVAAAVFVNDEKAGVMGFPPYEIEITPFLRSGDNVLTIKILNSRRNSHGPFHHKEKWPEWTGPGEFMFDDVPLQLVPCGLMAPPVLEERK